MRLKDWQDVPYMGGLPTLEIDGSIFISDQGSTEKMMERFTLHPETIDPIMIDSYPAPVSPKRWNTPNPFYILVNLYTLPSMRNHLRD
jgi:hypothetical protein